MSGTSNESGADGMKTLSLVKGNEHYPQVP